MGVKMHLYDQNILSADHVWCLTHDAAKTSVHLWCMERQTYRTIITNKSKKKREQLMGFLKT